MKYFISHVWDRQDLYLRVNAKLDCCLPTPWTDLSVQTEDALMTWRAGYQRGEQELQLQARRRELLDQQLADARARHASAERRLNLRSIRDKLAEKAQQRWIRMRDELAGERLINLDKRLWEQEDALLASELVTTDIAEEQANLTAALGDMNGLSADLANCSRRIAVLQRDFGRGLHQLHYDARELLHQMGKMSAAAVDLDPNLAIALYVRLIESDLVVAIMDDFTLYRRWMDFEFEAAQGLDKPTIAVLCGGDLPRHIESRETVVVRWGIDNFCNAVSTIFADGRFRRRVRERRFPS